MTTIKIDRKTVKRNPNAFRQYYIFLPGPMEIKGSCKGELPAYLKDKVLVTDSYYSSNEPPIYDFIWDGEITRQDLEAIQCTRKPEINIELKRNSFKLESIWPEPEFFYKYENTNVCCTNCGHWVGYHDIKKDTFINEDGDEFEHDVCEFCGESDPFKYKFEVL